MNGIVAVEAGTVLVILVLLIWFATFLGRVVQAALALGVIESIAQIVLNVPGTGTDPARFATVLPGSLFILGEVAVITWVPSVALRSLIPGARRTRALTTTLAAIAWIDAMLVSLYWPLWLTAGVCIFPAVLVPELKYGGSVCELPKYPALVAIVALILSYGVAVIALARQLIARGGSGRSTGAPRPSDRTFTAA